MVALECFHGDDHRSFAHSHQAFKYHNRSAILTTTTTTHDYNHGFPSVQAPATRNITEFHLKLGERALVKDLGVSGCSGGTRCRRANKCSLLHLPLPSTFPSSCLSPDIPAQLLELFQPSAGCPSQAWLLFFEVRKSCQAGH